MPRQGGGEVVFCVDCPAAQDLGGTSIRPQEFDITSHSNGGQIEAIAAFRQNDPRGDDYDHLCSRALSVANEEGGLVPAGSEEEYKLGRATAITDYMIGAGLCHRIINCTGPEDTDCPAYNDQTFTEELGRAIT